MRRQFTSFTKMRISLPDSVLILSGSAQGGTGKLIVDAHLLHVTCSTGRMHVLLEYPALRESRVQCRNIQ